MDKKTPVSLFIVKHALKRNVDKIKLIAEFVSLFVDYIIA